jgi:membrane protease YdiL (CAAX protease family)
MPACLPAPQFFALTVLGSAASGFVLATGSVLPAVALHFGYNAAALSAGVLLAVPR